MGNKKNLKLPSVELCAGAGGQALGLEQAGFSHEALVEIDEDCRQTLRQNRPSWNVIDGPEADLLAFDGRNFKGIDLLAGGLPCPPFSIAGKQLGQADERNLFPAALRIAEEIRPKAILLENVRGFLGPRFTEYRQALKRDLLKLGYHTDWNLFNAANFGVPQLRPRVIIVALKKPIYDEFQWPLPLSAHPPTVGEALEDLMQANNWADATRWKSTANNIAPTIVGGSKKHGGPDLGPTRAKAAWATLGVNAHGIAEDAPGKEFKGVPKLTVRMVARLQGFPDDWTFSGRKTSAYRQVGNAFPPPVARTVAQNVHNAIISARKTFQIPA